MLSIKNLNIRFSNKSILNHAVKDLSFHLEKNETLAIVGESSCGKTVTCKAILKLNRENETSGEIIYNGQDLIKFHESDIQRIRGDKIAMIFQDPISSLNPLVKIGIQIIEVIKYHQHVPKKEAKNIAIALLGEMGIKNPEQTLSQYPHQQSGGINQRVLIAMALSCKPELLIADEPTSSLDVTVQTQILKIFKQLKEKRKLGILFVTHNLGVVYEIADRVLVMYNGMLMEEGATIDIFENALHPYTKALLSSIPFYGKEKIILSEKQLNQGNTVGCPFASRCQSYIGDICITKVPDIVKTPHNVRCHLYNK